MSTWHLDRGSKEFVGPLEVLADNLIAPFEVALLPRGVRPVEGDWDPPDDVDDEDGLLVGPGTTRVLTPGMWDLWVRITDNPEIPVLGPRSTNPPGFVRVT